jgi:hypothetical protein
MFPAMCNDNDFFTAPTSFFPSLPSSHLSLEFPWKFYPGAGRHKVLTIQAILNVILNEECEL